MPRHCERSTYVRRLAVQLHELGDVKLGRLQDLGLPHVDVLEGVDAPRRLLDLATDRLRNELLHELLEVAARRLARHDLEHLLPDLPHLRRLGVGRLANLRRSTLGKADGEEAEKVAVSRLDVDVGLDEGLPLADKGTELVGREVHAVEVGEAVLALNLVHP